MASDNGQKCPTCKGRGIIVKKQGAFSFMNRNRTFEDEMPMNCGTCYGTGWLSERSQ